MENATIRKTTPNMGFAKMAGDVVLEIFCFLITSVQGDNEVLSVRHLRKALTVMGKLMEQIDSKYFTITYADACPSELIHSSTEPLLSIGLINYMNLDRGSLRKINQYKNTRGIARKLKTQEYLISAMKSGLIIPIGVISWNKREVALKNGEFILSKYNIVEKQKDFKTIVELNGQEISYGHLVSLAWYSMALATFAKNIGEITKYEKKQNAIILIDLLPGDNQLFRRNLKVVRHIIDQSELIEFFDDVVIKHGLNKLGFGYGIKDDSTKAIKNDFEYVIVDWIVQSFNSLLLYEKMSLSKETEIYKLSELARFLIQNNQVKLMEGFELID